MRAKYVDLGAGQRGLRFFCPACNENHIVRITGPNAWGFNHDLEHPTITPSIDVASGHFARPGIKECYCNYHERFPDKPPLSPTFRCRKCHSFVTNGQIQYLADCSHALANSTVTLPEIPSHKDYDER